MTTHTNDCQGGAECAALDGDWNQPTGDYVTAAQAQLDDDAPWCQIHHLAWQLVGQDEHNALCEAQEDAWEALKAAAHVEHAHHLAAVRDNLPTGEVMAALEAFHAAAPAEYAAYRQAVEAEIHWTNENWDWVVEANTRQYSFTLKATFAATSEEEALEMFFDYMTDPSNIENGVEVEEAIKDAEDIGLDPLNIPNHDEEDDNDEMEEVLTQGPHTCVLCDEVFTGYGNNPEPLVEWPARCCDDCNWTKVIPARLRRMSK